MNISSLPMNIVFSSEIGSMKTDSKTKTFRRWLCGILRPDCNSPPLQITPDFYQFLALMPGTYSVTANGKGFHDIEALVRVLVGTLQDLRLEVFREIHVLGGLS